MDSERIKSIAERVIATGVGVSREEAMELLESDDTDALCDAADRICKAFHGNRVDTCSIVNARSGIGSLGVCDENNLQIIDFKFGKVNFSL